MNEIIAQAEDALFDNPAPRVAIVLNGRMPSRRPQYTPPSSGAPHVVNFPIEKRGSPLERFNSHVEVIIPQCDSSCNRLTVSYIPSCQIGFGVSSGSLSPEEFWRALDMDYKEGRDQIGRTGWYIADEWAGVLNRPEEKVEQVLNVIGPKGSRIRAMVDAGSARADLTIQWPLDLEKGSCCDSYIVNLNLATLSRMVEYGIRLTCQTLQL